MTEAGSLIPLLVLVGPTASGKTKLAIDLAQNLNGEVISADSRILYQELQIGVAKPSLSELDTVPHHLISIATLDDPWSLGQYQQTARATILDVSQRKRLPILCGGTGQYVRALLQNWQVPALEEQPRLRTAIENWGEEVGYDQLWKALGIVDAKAAQAIDPRNKRRTVRAWEVILSTGKRFSSRRGIYSSPYNTLTLGLEWPREVLYKRIDQRIDDMFDQGLLEEVGGLIAAGYGKSLKRMGIIGYSELIAYLEGEYSLEEAVRLLKRNTRIYVRRQANWFKAKDPQIVWLKADDPALLENALDRVNSWLNLN